MQITLIARAFAPLTSERLRTLIGLLDETVEALVGFQGGEKFVMRPGR
jgi:hypothetical protein